MQRPAPFLVLVLLAAATSAQDPQFERRHRMTPDAWFVASIEVADLSGDGIPDLLLRQPAALEVWKGGPDGAFDELLWSVAVDPYLEEGQTLLDVEGDGDLDLALAQVGLCYFTCAGSTNRLFLNDGAGGFAEAFGHFPPNDDHPNRFALAGDLDQDGDLDLVFGGSKHCWVDVFGHQICKTSEALVWRNDGFGTFADVPGALGLESEIETGVCADFSGDGAAELFLGFGGFESLYANDGTGLFTQDFPGVGPHPFSQDLQMASALDADLDGDLDLVATYKYMGTGTAARLFVNDGAGVLPWDSGELAGYHAQVHAVLDFEQDGDPDLVTGDVWEARRHANDGAGHFADLGALAGYQDPRDTAAGDVDLDGDDDLLLDVQLFLGDGSGALVRATEPIPWPYSPTERAQALLDLEGDGDLDAAVVNASFARNDLYANDGAGHFTQVPGGAFEESGGADFVLAADLDGDGDQDLAATDASNALLFRNAGGSFDTRVSLPGTAGSKAIAAADVDGNGTADLAVGHGSAANLLFLGAGGGVFVPAPGVLPAIPTATRSLLFLDFDGDGDPDLVEGVQGEDHLYRNDGSAFADAPALLPSNPLWTTSYAAGDVDQDGDLDLMAGTFDLAVDVPNRLFLNTGAGFVDATASLSPAEGRTYDLALADLDLDGDLDAFWVNASGSMLLANDGAGAFAHVPGAEGDLSPVARSFAAGDLDGDGDTDLFASSIVDHGVHFNLHGQLAWRALPRVGKPLAFELDGAPGTLWVQAWSTGTAAIPLAPFGVLRLDPAHVFPLGSGVFDAAGEAGLAFGVPAVPALAGLTLYTQALHGSPLVFGNLETVGLTNL